jgi:DNA polymerase
VKKNRESRIKINIMKKSLQLKKLNTKWMKECRCTLRSTTIQAVLGSGDPDADILFIGEAPGKKEDEQGIPFIGSAGKFLDELLASINLSRADIYITNTVKYRPPENRDPSPEEILACRDWIREEIRVIDPKMIVTLGRHAMHSFLPDAKISEVHGKSFRKNIIGIGDRHILPLYHPAAALYNGGLRTTLQQDFKKISRILKNIEG